MKKAAATIKAIKVARDDSAETAESKNILIRKGRDWYRKGLPLGTLQIPSMNAVYQPPSDLVQRPSL
jgi:hypothetical protein